MIMPRRYGGLCLPLAEAMTSGLPVFRSSVSPNNELPADWLIPGEFRYRREVKKVRRSAISRSGA